MIRLSLQGLLEDPGLSNLDSLHQHFATFHSARLEGLVSPPLVDFLLRNLSDGDFHETNIKVASEFSVTSSPAVQVLRVLLNDKRVRQAVERVTGCQDLGIFNGRIYRLLPNKDHQAHWHDDVTGGRRIGMSINLSREPYEGGCFEMRHAISEDFIAALPNLGLGDAILFRIDKQLQHRVTPLLGRTPKTAFAGWYTDSVPSIKNYF